MEAKAIKFDIFCNFQVYVVYGYCDFRTFSIEYSQILGNLKSKPMLENPKSQAVFNSPSKCVLLRGINSSQSKHKEFQFLVKFHPQLFLKNCKEWLIVGSFFTQFAFKIFFKISLHSANRYELTKMVFA